MEKEIKIEFENLDSMIKSGFDNIDERFDNIGNRLDSVETGVNDIKITLTTQYPTKSFLTEELLKLEERLGKKIDKIFESVVRFRLKVVEIFKQLNVSLEDISELEKIVEQDAQSYVVK